MFLNSSRTSLTLTGPCRPLLDGRRQPGGFARFENVWSSASSSSQGQGGRHLERLVGDASTSTQRFERVQSHRRRRRCGSHSKRRLKESGVIEGHCKTTKTQPQLQPLESNREDRPQQSLRPDKHHVLHRARDGREEASKARSDGLGSNIVGGCRMFV
jgi:hypothetical protein